MRRGIRSALLGALAVSLIGGAALGDNKFELAEAELDRVTAGTQLDDQELLTFDFVRTTQSGKTISVEGSLDILSKLIANSPSTIYLGDGAQGNLTSLVNINAIHSQISVLLNLNIIIDSSVGTLNQLNINTSIPVVIPPSH